MDRWLLSFLFLWPLVGFFVTLALPRAASASRCRNVGYLFSLPPLVVSGYLLVVLAQSGWRDGAGDAFQVAAPWFSVGDLTIHYALFIDGLSAPLVALSALLTVLCIGYSQIEHRAKEYFALFLLLEVGMLGTFLAADFFLFYVFWELSLLPMYFIIGIWGGARREFAAIKFFLYTLVGSVAMLLAMIWLYLIVPQKTLLLVPLSGADAELPTLVQQATLAIRAAPALAMPALLAWSGIFLGFAIKVPAWPFHTWLPDAHTEAPTAGSVILAGVLLKMGGYGLFRVLLPILPDQSFEMRFLVLGLGVIGVIYGALVALAQSDLKKLIAYSSVNHMGYVMMGVAAACAVLGPGSGDVLGIVEAAKTSAAGAIYQMIAHGILTSGLFLLVGVIYDRTHTRELASYGGLGVPMSEYGGYFKLFAFGSLGLPTLAGFIAEFLVFVGTFQIDRTYRIGTALAGIGIVVTAAFLLLAIQKVLLGPVNPRWAKLPDLTWRERVPLAVLGLLALLLGLFPQPLLATMQTYLAALPLLGGAVARVAGG